MLLYMVILTIQQAAKKRGITSSYQLMKLLNVPPGTAARLWRSEMKMVSLETLERLCEALDCELIELLSRVPNKKVRRSSR